MQTYVALARQDRQDNGNEALAQHEDDPEDVPLNAVPNVQRDARPRVQRRQRIEEHLHDHEASQQRL